MAAFHIAASEAELISQHMADKVGAMVVVRVSITISADLAYVLSEVCVQLVNGDHSDPKIIKT
jgi:hypothetical protein